jgi:hypothetical protein
MLYNLIKKQKNRTLINADLADKKRILIPTEVGMIFNCLVSYQSCLHD